MVAPAAVSGATVVTGSAVVAGPDASGSSSRVPSSAFRSWIRCSACEASAIAQRDRGSGSIIRPIGSASTPARSGAVGRSAAILLSSASALGWSGYGPCPSTAAYSVAPSAHTSEAGEASSPRACSGEKYAGVPVTIPDWVSVASPWVRAMPKSEILARSSSVTRMFPGLTSRCTVPRACAAASPSATWAPIHAARSGGSGPSAATICDSVRPGTYSITSQMWSPSSIAS